MPFRTRLKNGLILNKDTVGKQIIHTVDSICANIAKGNGRYNYQDSKRFVKIARGSFSETVN